MTYGENGVGEREKSTWRGSAHTKWKNMNASSSLATSTASSVVAAAVGAIVAACVSRGACDTSALAELERHLGAAMSA